MSSQVTSGLMVAGGLVALLLGGCPATGSGVDLGTTDDAGGQDLWGQEDQRAPMSDLPGGGDMAGPADMGPAAYVPVCTPSKWCWENPLPQGNELLAVRAVSANDVWAAGRVGTMLHYDGTKWAAVPSGVEEDLYALWSSAANDVWAVGYQGTIVHWNGTAWAKVPSGGTWWLQAIWGSGPNDIWVGGDGPMLRWNGMTWSQVPKGSGASVWGLWGSGPGNIYATTTGAPEAPLQWNGTAWTPLMNFPTREYTQGVWGSGPNDVWFFSLDPYRFNGTLFQRMDPPRGVGVPSAAAWGTGPNNVWSVGGRAVARWDGTKWNQQGLFPLDVDEHLNAINGSGSDDVWTVSYRLFHWLRAAWSQVGDGERGILFFDGWASGAGDAWAVGAKRGGGGVITKRVGGRWVVVNNTPMEIHGIWGSSPTEIWVVGSKGTILRWNGMMWQSVASPTMEILTSIHGSTRTNVFAVGAKGTIIRWDGTSWSAIGSGTSRTLSSVFVLGPTDGWISGDDGTLLRWDGSKWSPVASGVSWPLIRVWGTSSNNLWATGSFGTLLRWNGTIWSQKNLGTTVDFNDIYGTRSDDLWLIGGSSTTKVFHWDGTHWNSEPPLATSLYRLFGAGNDVWASGNFGTILHWSP